MTSCDILLFTKLEKISPHLWNPTQAEFMAQRFAQIEWALNPPPAPPPPTPVSEDVYNNLKALNTQAVQALKALGPRTAANSGVYDNAVLVVSQTQDALFSVVKIVPPTPVVVPQVVRLVVTTNVAGDGISTSGGSTGTAMTVTGGTVAPTGMTSSIDIEFSESNRVVKEYDPCANYYDPNDPYRPIEPYDPDNPYDPRNPDFDPDDVKDLLAPMNANMFWTISDTTAQQRWGEVRLSFTGTVTPLGSPAMTAQELVAALLPSNVTMEAPRTVIYGVVFARSSFADNIPILAARSSFDIKDLSVEFGSPQATEVHSTDGTSWGSNYWTAELEIWNDTGERWWTHFRIPTQFGPPVADNWAQWPESQSLNLANLFMSNPGVQYTNLIAWVNAFTTLGSWTAKFNLVDATCGPVVGRITYGDATWEAVWPGYQAWFIKTPHTPILRQER